VKDVSLEQFFIMSQAGKTHMVERLCKELCAAAVRDVAVHGMRVEEFLLLAAGLVHREVEVNVLLRPVDDTDKAELERVCPASENLERVGACVHEVELGENTERAKTTGVDGARELEGVRVGQVDIGRGDCEDNPG